MDFPVIEKKWRRGMHAFDIVYPNKKYGGSYNLGMLIIYNLVNSFSRWECKRVFLDEGKITAKLIGFTLQYELDIYNLFKMLERDDIPLEKEKREHVILAGGPFVNTNPHALERYADLFVMGDAEETIPLLLENYEKENGKAAFLKSVSSLPGVYVPGMSTPSFSYVQNLDDAPYPLYQPLPAELPKEYVFGNAFLLEVERGCPFSCKFCPMPLKKNIRHRSLGNIKKIIDEGIALNKRTKVVLYTPSFSHPQRKEIMRYLLEKGLEFSVPSIRVELADREFLELIKKGGQRTLTIAPECGERLRFKIGKPTKDKAYFRFLEMASSLGFREVKCYFMIGLPSQTDEDTMEMVALIKKIKSCFRNSYISINPFVSKPGTELGDHPFDAKMVKKQAAFIKKELGKAGIIFKMQGISAAKKEWELSRLKQ